MEHRRVRKINFLFKKERRTTEIIFRNQWKVNKNNQSVYTYKKRLDGKVISDSFTLRGEWKFKKGNLIYFIENSKKPILSFKVFTKRSFIKPKKGKLEFEIGKEKLITLWGKWRIEKGGVEFIVKFNGKIKIGDSG